MDRLQEGKIYPPEKVMMPTRTSFGRTISRFYKRLARALNRAYSKGVKLTLLVLGAILLACSSSASSTAEGAAQLGSSCAAVGGTCVPGGGVNCSKPAAANAQDCNPPLETSGAFCCMTP